MMDTSRHTTSIDALKVDYTTVSRVGQKRTYDRLGSDLGSNCSGSNVNSAETTSRVTTHRLNTQATLIKPLKAGKIRGADRSHLSGGISEYSQRRTLALTPSPVSDPRLELSHASYGLPMELVCNLRGLGIYSIYPWQSECLLESGALNGTQNLVYTAPTG